MLIIRRRLAVAWHSFGECDQSIDWQSFVLVVCIVVFIFFSSSSLALNLWLTVLSLVNEIPNKYLNQFNTNHYISYRAKTKKNIRKFVGETAIGDLRSSQPQLTIPDLTHAYVRTHTHTKQNGWKLIQHNISCHIFFFVRLAHCQFLLVDRHRRGHAIRSPIGCIEERKKCTSADG